MQSSKNANSKPYQLLQKTFQYKSKNNNYSHSSKNLTMSIGSNESPNKFTGGYRLNFFKKQSQKQVILEENQNSQKDFLSKHLSIITQENKCLKQENQNLKKQLNKFKYESRSYQLQEKYRGSYNEPMADLRGTIKKQNQTSQTKQLRLKLQVLSKQCKMYQQIIDKMQKNIKKIAEQNKILKQTKSIEGDHFKQIKRQELQALKQKVNLVMKQYSSLQSKMHSQELQWIVWKQQWISQKNIYINRIRVLENKLKLK